MLCLRILTDTFERFQSDEVLRGTLHRPRAPRATLLPVGRSFGRMKSNSNRFGAADQPCRSSAGRAPGWFWSKYPSIRPLLIARPHSFVTTRSSINPEHHSGLDHISQTPHGHDTSLAPSNSDHGFGQGRDPPDTIKHNVAKSRFLQKDT